MNNVINYLPVKERTPDNQYHICLSKIMRDGKTKIPIHAHLAENQGSGHGDSKDVTGYELRFDLKNGFPLLPIRDLRKSFKGSIGEIVGFLNGARTIEEMEKFGCPRVFWEKWVTSKKCADFGLQPGDLGTYSYGPTLRAMPGVHPGETFDQVLAIERLAKERPYARNIALSTWYAPCAVGDKEQNSPREVVVAPCHGNFVLFKFYDDGDMHMNLIQRSADVPVGVVMNLVEWCAVGMMFAHLLKRNFTTYVHYMMDAQIYDIQYPHVAELLNREALILPTVILAPKEERNHIWEFRREDFILSDYNPHARMDIPTPV